MLISSEGVVLGSIKYGDNSLISHVFTKEKGLISLISSKTKKGKPGFVSYFQPLSFIQFVCYSSKKASVSRVKEVSFSDDYNAFETDIATNSLRYFIAEFLSKIIREHEQNNSLYQFLEKELKQLHSRIDKRLIHFNFLVALLNELGLQPHLNEEDPYFDLIEGTSVKVKPKHTDYCERETMLYFKNKISSNMSLNKTSRVKLLNTILRYYSIQLNVDLENLKSKQVFEIVFG